MNLKSLIITAAIGQTGKETVISAVLGAIVGYLGGWDAALRVLVWLMVADYLSGLFAAVKTKSVNSEVMFWGGVRKSVVLGVIALAAACDQLVGDDAPVFRTLAVYFYAGREGLSVVENLAKLGIPMPPGMSGFLEQLKQRGEGGSADERRGDKA